VLTITICVGSSCYVRGSEKLAESFQRLLEDAGLSGRVEMTGAFCMEQCSMGVSVRVNDRIYRGVQVEDAGAFFYNEILPKETPEPAR
jgi:NADH:ubiquinone oxidoreductase subunit E